MSLHSIYIFFRVFIVYTGASVNLAAIIEYLAADGLELAGNAARDDNKYENITILIHY